MRRLSLLGIVFLASACGGEGRTIDGVWNDPWEDRTGSPVPETVVWTTDDPGGNHCEGWDTAVFLHVGWPLGRPYDTRDDSGLRQYIRDPEGVFDPKHFRVPLDLDAALPRDARDSGFHLGEIELWVSPSDAREAIYVVRGETVERWPRSEPPIFCA